MNGGIQTSLVKGIKTPISINYQWLRVLWGLGQSPRFAPYAGESPLSQAPSVAFAST